MFLFLYLSQPIGIYGFKGSTLYLKLYTFVGIILVVAQNLLDMDNF